MNKPSEEWKNYLHVNTSLEKASKNSYDLYIKKYAKRDAQNPPKEEAERNLIPGKMYTCVYTTGDKPNPERPFINRRPVFISLGRMESNGKIYETGIDLMLVPPKVRIFMLDAFYKYYRKDLKENVDNINEGRKGKKALRINYENAKVVFDHMGWQMAFQTYDRAKMMNPAVYDYSDWVSVIPLYTKGIEGKQVQELYNEYIKKINNPPEPVNEMEVRKKKELERKKKEMKKSSGNI